MPAFRGDGDADFAIPVRAIKIDADGFVTLENAAVVAIRAAPDPRVLPGTPCESLAFTIRCLATPSFCNT
jgi:hypothetical protein